MSFLKRHAQVNFTRKELLIMLLSIVFSIFHYTQNLALADHEQAPIIIVKGETEITINVGDSYIDEGVLAYDFQQGFITQYITKIGSVDTSTPGVYTLIYNVRDAEWNYAIPKTRTITVKEKDEISSKPIFISFSVKDFNGTTAKVHFTTSEATQAIVGYGENKSYTMFTTPEKSFDYSTHIQPLKNIEDGKIYDYIIYVRNENGISNTIRGQFEKPIESSTSSYPYGKNDNGWAYCGPSNKQPGTWDDLRNYGDGSIEGGCIVKNTHSSDTSESEVSSAPYGKNDKGWAYCGPSNKQPGTWDDLRNYGDGSIEGGCIISGTSTSSETSSGSSSGGSGISNTTKSVTSKTSITNVSDDAPYGESKEGWKYCGPSDKQPGTWDDLRNYGDGTIEGGCIIKDENPVEKPIIDNSTSETITANGKKGYTLRFSDEFNGNSVDSSKWNSGFLWGPNVTINNEEQYYVDILGGDFGKKNPFSFENGSLVISAEKIPHSEKSKYNNKNYTSGLLTSYDAHYYTYGYTEARVKIPRGKGLWPAFWQLNHKYSPGLAEPEIDIMENLGDNTNKVYQTYHYRDTSQSHRPFKKQESYRTEHDYADDYHIYAAERGPGFIQFYIDDQPTNRIEGNDVVASENMYILINLAVGGGWPGSPDGNTQFPAKYYIDYIRMYGN